MPSAFVTRVAQSLTLDERRVLLSTAKRGEAKLQAADGDGKLRYELKRKGCISVTRPDGNGRFYAYRTAIGDEVIAALPAPRVRKRAVQPVAA